MANRTLRFTMDVLEMIRTKDPDEGQAILTPRTLYRNVRCDFEDKTGFEGGKEKEGELGSIAAPIDSVFTIRYHPRMNITNKHRILFRGIVYNVVRVLDRQRKAGEGGFKEKMIYTITDQNGT